MKITGNYGIRFGHFEVVPARRQILATGQAVALGARAFDLLLVLIEHRERMLSKDELLALVWPGVVVEENNLTVQISALRKLLGPDAIATVAGRGYRFVQPGLEIQELGVPSDVSPATALPIPAAPNPIASAAVSPAPERSKSFATPGDSLALPEKPSIAILPFVNISGDAEQSYFTDGLTEDITTDLSRFHSLFVIARNSAFTYQGRSVDVRQVARELGVRYVLEGSARRSGARVRVNAQLIDAITGNHIWADKYDRVIEDIFDLQEDLTKSIVSAIATQVHVAEQNIARRLRPGNLRAHDMAMRANANNLEAHRRNDRVLWNQALREARQALALDGNNLLAHLVIAEIQTENVGVPQFANGDLKADWKEGISSAGKAMELDPADSRAYGWAGFLMAVAGFYDEGLAYARQGLALNPNDCITLSNLAATEVWSGEYQAALGHVAVAERLSPRDPNRFHFNACRASACFFLQDFDAGIAYATASVRDAPHSAMSQMSLVLVAVGAGQIERAKAAFETLRAISPAYAHRALTHDPPLRKPEDRQRFALATRIAAGLEAPARAAELRMALSA
jgi:adenylate cyclase